MNELISLKDLFTNKIFRIPDYQRGYAWNLEQLIDFWDDIMTLSPQRYHYTGMISLKKLKKSQYANWDDEMWLLNNFNNPYDAYHVVDGQQRLTTFIILLNEIVQFVLSISNNENPKDIVFCHASLFDIVSKYIKIYRNYPMSNATYLFGYEVDNPSFLYMKHQILNEPNGGTLEETFYTLNLQNAKEFFSDRINDLYIRKGIEALEELYLKLSEKLIFNIHDIDDEFDVFVAFETMNNRGKKLSNLEILKNRLIYLTTLYPDVHLNEYDKKVLRNDINTSWKEIYKQLGRNKKTPLDDDEFLRAHWTMFFKYSRNKGDDYIKDLLGRRFNPKNVMKFNDEFLDFNQQESITTDSYDDDLLVPLEIKKYVVSLKSLAQYWFYSFNPRMNTSLDEEEIIWIEKLNRIGMNSFRTLLVSALFNNYSSSQRSNLFKAMERFIFICFRLGGFNSSFNNTEFFKLAREQFLKIKSKSIEDITKRINDITNNNIFVATKAFKNRVDRFLKDKGFYSWDYLKYFLFEYEYEKVKLTGIEKFGWDYFSTNEKDKVSIEHIFPQTPTKWYWMNLYRQFNEEEKEILAGSLGNLLPLSQRINSSLQNDEFELKKNSKTDERKGYSNNSYSAIEISKNEDWSAQDIYQRGLSLLTFMEERWDFKFQSEDFKVSLLNLEFVNDGRIIPPEILKFEDKNIGISEPLNKDFSRIEYWDSFVRYCRSCGKEKYVNQKTSNYSYYVCRFNKGFNYTFKVNKKVIELEIYCWNNDIYQIVKSKKNELEEALLENIKWDISKEQSISKRAVLDKEIDYTDKSLWTECFLWYVSKIEIVSSILNKYFEVDNNIRVKNNLSLKE